MSTLSPYQRLACAATVLFGRHGSVTQTAQEHGLSRQGVYRQSQAVIEDLEGQRQREELDQLRRERDQLQARCVDLQKRLDQAVIVDQDRQAEFAACGQAQGVSLPVLRRLLRIILDKRVPSVAKLGRWTKAAGERSSALLEVLDKAVQPHVRQASADEIFVRRKPILMVIEPKSLCWVSGRQAPCRDGKQWAEEFARWPMLEQVTKDGGNGLANGLKRVNDQRCQRGQATVAEQDDHFHVLREGYRALRVSEMAARRTWDKAYKAKRVLSRPGHRQAGYASHAAKLAGKAEQAFTAWDSQDRAWRQIASAMCRFRPEGTLQTRPQAEASVTSALPKLVGPAWAKVRRLLARPQLWTYLDRMHAQLAALSVAAELREAALDLEAARRRPQMGYGQDAKAAAWRGVVLMASVVLSRAGPAGAEAVAQVRDVLSRTWRASSLVEGVNSVLRMQQARHRRLTPGLLDLKRLYWNVQPFRTGKRRDRSPYEWVGLRGPAVGWWELLRWSPEALRDHLERAAPIGQGSDQDGKQAGAEAGQELSASGLAA